MKGTVAGPQARLKALGITDDSSGRWDVVFSLFTVFTVIIYHRSHSSVLRGGGRHIPAPHCEKGSPGAPVGVLLMLMMAGRLNTVGWVWSVAVGTKFLALPR